MNCDAARAMIPRLVDAELPGAERRRLDDHLAGCAECRRATELERARAAVLHDNAQRYTAPLALRASLAAAVAEAEHPAMRLPSRREGWLRWLVPLATGIAGCVLGAAIAVQTPLYAGRDRIGDDLVDNHVRSLMTAHLTDVVSGNRHDVKPWFAGRIAFSPPVADLSPLGFTLVGGRLEYVDRHPVAAIVYRRGGHVINAYVWPSSSGAGRPSERDGYHVVARSLPDRALYAVSDLNAAELGQFADALAAALARGES